MPIRNPERMAFEGIGTRRDDLANLLKWLDIQGIRPGAPLEHCIEAGLRLHEYWLTTPPLTLEVRLVVIHPNGCGCDSLPDHVLLEG